MDTFYFFLNSDKMEKVAKFVIKCIFYTLFLTNIYKKKLFYLIFIENRIFNVKIV